MDEQWDGVAAARLHRQGLWAPTAADAPAVLDALVAMQGQEFAYALWALAQRVRPADRPGRADLLAAFDRGDILRTHVLRTTWHLVRPRDVRPLLRLTAPRLRRQLAGYDRQLGLDRAEIDRAEALLAEELAGGRQRTRRELADALAAAGIAASGQRLGHLMMHAELDEVLISGAMAGQQHTYAAFADRVPAPGERDEADALVELAARYVAGRAPVTAKDFAGWASLTLTQARAGLDATGVAQDQRDGVTYYGETGPGPAAAAGRAGRPRIDLLQGYDEMIMSYSQSRAAILPGGSKATAGLPVLNGTTYLHAVLIDGVLAGHWRHRLTATQAVVELQSLRPWSAAERRAIDDAVQDYGRYLDRPVAADVTTQPS